MSQNRGAVRLSLDLGREYAAAGALYHYLVIHGRLCTAGCIQDSRDTRPEASGCRSAFVSAATEAGEEARDKR